MSLSHIAVVYLGGFLLIGRAATGVSQLAVSYVVWFDVSLSHIAVVYLGWIPAHRASRHWCLPASCILCCVIWRVVVTYSSGVSGGFLLIGRAATGVSQLAVSYVVWFDVSLSHIAVVYLGWFPAHRASRHWCLPASCILCCVIWRVVVTYSSGVSGGFPAHRASRHWCLPASCILCCVIWRVVVTYSSGVSGGFPAHRASRHWCLPASCILCCVIWRVVVTYSSGVSGGDSCS